MATSSTDINELNGLWAIGEHAHYERMNLLIDSGASICGCPLAAAEGEPRLPREGAAEYSTANNGVVKNEGGVQLIAAFQNGDEHSMKFKVLDIKRLIASVSQLEETGHRVVFDSEADGGS